MVKTVNKHRSFAILSVEGAPTEVDSLREYVTEIRMCCEISHLQNVY